MLKSMSKGKEAYEARRALKAGKSLQKWMEEKAKKGAEAEPIAKPAKKPGLFSRLLDRAHQPLKPKS